MFRKISYTEKIVLEQMLAGALHDLNRVDRFMVRNKIYETIMSPSRDATFWEIHEVFTDVLDTRCDLYGISGDPLCPDGV